MRELPQITELALSAADLRALAKQGFVSSQRRGRRTIYKLRFRLGGVQQIRYLGSDTERSAEIQAALKAWQTPRRLQQELRSLVAAGRALRRSIRPRLAEQVAHSEFRLHGRRLRRPRSASDTRPSEPRLAGGSNLSTA